jgi:DNA-binding transcriptional LysR family regulator
LVVFAKPTHPLLRASKGLVRRADLAPYPLFVSDAAGDFQVLVQRLFKSIGTQPKIEAKGSVDGVKRAVIAGTNALGLLPGYSVSEEFRLGTLRHVDIDPDLPRVRLTALLSPSRARHPVIDELLDALGRVIRSA